MECELEFCENCGVGLRKNDNCEELFSCLCNGCIEELKEKK